MSSDLLRSKSEVEKLLHDLAHRFTGRAFIELINEVAPLQRHDMTPEDKRMVESILFLLDGAFVLERGLDRRHDAFTCACGPFHDVLRTWLDDVSAETLEEIRVFAQLLSDDRSYDLFLLRVLLADRGPRLYPVELWLATPAEKTSTELLDYFGSR